MSNISKIFANAVAEHGKGNLARARLLYLQVIKAQPKHADALMRLGVTSLQDGKVQDAVTWFGRATQAQPAMAAAHSNLGVALRRLGQIDQAITAYERAVTLVPNDATFRTNLGNALQTAGHWDRAEQQFSQAATLATSHPNPLICLGNLYMACGRWVDAQPPLRQAMALASDQPHAADKNLAAQATASLSLVLHELEQDDQALDLARQALAHTPDNALAAKAMGIALTAHDPDQSAHYLRRAVTLDPSQADAWNALGNREGSAGNAQQAVACYDRAIAANPANKDARVNKSRALLLLGQWQQAWPDYEYRWGTAMNLPDLADKPRWNGQPFAGHTLLVHCEQGLGDSIQFLRYLPLVKSLGGQVVMGIQPELLRTIQGLPEVDMAVPVGTPLPPFDLHVPLLSLPGLFGTLPHTIPPISPLAAPTPAHIQQWDQRLPPRDGRLRVGLVWAGNPNFKADNERSPGLDVMARLLTVPGITFVSLQKGPGAAALAQRAGSTPLVDMGSQAQDFADTGAIMANLDLVISSCTAPLHMAGTVGAKTWAILPFVPDWRWMLDRDDTPWYPTMRLYRQPRRHDWDSVIQRVQADLTALAST